MADVFISYKRDRRAAARHLAKILEAYGYTVWFDLALVRGQDYEEQIAAQLIAAKAVIVLWCTKSVASAGVRSEATRAKTAGKLVPLVIEACELPLFSTLEQNINLTAATGAPSNLFELAAVLDDLERLVGRAPQPDLKALRDYEATWRSLGALPFAKLPLEVVPIAEAVIGGGGEVELPRPPDHSATVSAAPVGRNGGVTSTPPPPIPHELANVRIDYERDNLIEAYGAAISVQGGLVALGGKGGHTALWDGRSGNLLRLWNANGRDVKAVALSADGVVLATHTHDSITRLWRTAGQEAHIAEVASGNHWRYVDLMAPGALLLRGDQNNPGQVHLFKGDHKSSQWTVGGMAPVWSVRASPDGHRIAAGMQNGHTRLLDARDGRHIRDLGPNSGENRYIVALAYSPDGARLATGSDVGTAHVWGVATNRGLNAFTLQGRVGALAFCSRGRHLAAGGKNKTITVWDTTIKDAGTNAEVVTLTGHENAIHAVAFIRNDTRLISASQDGTVKVWDVASGQVIATLVAFLDGAYAVLMADGRYAGSPGVERYLFQVENDIEHGVTSAYRAHFHCPDGLGDLF